MESILYVGTNKGMSILHGNDDGSWTKSEGDLPSVPVEMIAVSPEMPNRVFAGTRGDGVWMSEDFGESFHKPGWGKRGPGKVRSLSLDPNDPDRLYAGCEPIDLFVSNDLGESWERVDSLWDHPWISQVPYSSTKVEPHVRFICVDPVNQGTLYLALQVGYIIKTADWGKTWELLDAGVDMDVHSIVTDPTDSRHVLAASGGHNLRHNLGLGQGGKALFGSRDGGASWAPLAMDLPGTYAISIVAGDQHPGFVFTAVAPGTPGQWKRQGVGDNGMLIRSNDGGDSWQVLDTAGAEGFGDTLAAAITIDRVRPERVYAVGRNGTVISSRDAGDSWQAVIEEKSVNDLQCVSA